MKPANRKNCIYWVVGAGLFVSLFLADRFFVLAADGNDSENAGALVVESSAAAQPEPGIYFQSSDVKEFQAFFQPAEKTQCFGGAEEPAGVETEIEAPAATMKNQDENILIEEPKSMNPMTATKNQPVVAPNGGVKKPTVPAKTDISAPFPAKPKSVAKIETKSQVKAIALAAYKKDEKGRLVCSKKNDKPSKSDSNKKGHMDRECCLDPDEVPNPRCYYPVSKYGDLLD